MSHKMYQKNFEYKIQIQKTLENFFTTQKKKKKIIDNRNILHLIHPIFPPKKSYHSNL